MDTASAVLTWLGEMDFGTRVLVLVVAAAWGPALIGAIAWLMFFGPEEHQMHAQSSEPPPLKVTDPNFAVDNYEPTPGNHNFQPFEDAPFEDRAIPP